MTTIRYLLLISFAGAIMLIINYLMTPERTGDHPVAWLWLAVCIGSICYTIDKLKEGK